MLGKAKVESLASHWNRGWNTGDLNTIMAPFAVDVVFSSPFVPKLSGDPAKTTIDGYEAVRSYVADALRRTPGIRYTLDGTYAGTDAVVLIYTCYLPDGTVKRGADMMRVNTAEKVVEWRCHYTEDSVST